MPTAIRKDDKSKRVALELLGDKSGNLSDSFGKKKRYKRKKKHEQAWTAGEPVIDNSQDYSEDNSYW